MQLALGYGNDWLASRHQSLLLCLATPYGEFGRAAKDVKVLILPKMSMERRGKRCVGGLVWESSFVGFCAGKRWWQTVDDEIAVAWPFEFDCGTATIQCQLVEVGYFGLGGMFG